MTDTGFRVTDEKLDRFAACYMRSMDKQVLLEDDPHTSHYRHKRNFFSGGGGLVGTTADYMAFCEMLRQGGQFNAYQLLGRRTLELMTANHLMGGKSLAQMALGAFLRQPMRVLGSALVLPRHWMRLHRVRWVQATSIGAAERPRYFGSIPRRIYKSFS